MTPRKSAFLGTGRPVTDKISFLTADIRFSLKKRRKIREWILQVVKAEKKSTEEISFIFCSDEFLLALNRDYLNHDTLTDVISFGLSESPGSIAGEIYISIPRIRENAAKFMENVERELLRVMIHGVLHLAGYGDKNRKDKAVMHELEDNYLVMWQNINKIA